MSTNNKHPRRPPTESQIKTWLFAWRSCWFSASDRLWSCAGSRPRHTRSKFPRQCSRNPMRPCRQTSWQRFVQKRPRAGSPRSNRPSRAAPRRPARRPRAWSGFPAASFPWAATTLASCPTADLTECPTPVRSTGFRSTAFWMDRVEVTNRQYAAFVEATGYVTVAEHTPTAAEFPGAPRRTLSPDRWFLLLRRAGSTRQSLPVVGLRKRGQLEASRRA